MGPGWVMAGLCAVVPPQSGEAETGQSETLDWTDTSTSGPWAMLLGGPSKGNRRTEDRFEADPLPREEEPTVDIGGALRFNLRTNTWAGRSQAPDRAGFDTFRINANARYEGLTLNAEYRFYAGYNMLKHGYIGYEPVADVLSLQLGVTQVPFGILPYASHSFFFDIGYYVGLEDDYDLGVRFDMKVDGLDIKAAFFKNDEGHYTGSSRDSARYSYDLVRIREGALESAGISGARNVEEINQSNLRVALPIVHADGYETEIGLSGQLGQTFDDTTDEFGVRWAAAAHLDGDYGWLDVQLQAGYYDIDSHDPGRSDDHLVAMGAYDAPYAVAAEAYFVMANVAVEIPVDWGPISSVTIYEDFSTLQKVDEDFADSYQNVFGSLWVAGPLYVYLDLAMGKNHPWLGPNYNTALGRGVPNADWEARLNANVGWYF